MEKILDAKKVILIVVLLIISIISIFVVSKVASSTEFHAKSIQSLEEKKITVMELTAATAVASSAIASIPGDATTPLANQIMELSGYLLIVTGAIFLEKILLILTGYLSFTILIPIACLLCGIHLFVKNEVFKNLAIKLAIFAIAIFLIVPVSVKVTNLIESTYQTSINQTIEDAKNTGNEIEESEGYNGIISKAEEFISNIGENASGLIDKCKKVLSNFVDAIAILIITSCVIPIAVLIFFIWIIKIIFGISIPTPKIKKDKAE